MAGFKDMTLADFREQLSSKAPVPGGGGAAALAGALSASLLSMVGNLTVGKKKYAAYEPEIREKMEEADALSKKLLSLVDADAEAFAPLSRAYSLPKETGEEKKTKAAVMEQCLRDAAAVPYEIMQTCCRVIDLVGVFREKGSVLALSDAGCSAALAGAALQSAALNVSVNTRLMQDRGYAENLNESCQKMLDAYLPLARENVRLVGEKLAEPKHA
jgi:formiminotetrahydrofolate cyclodeaminase